MYVCVCVCVWLCCGQAHWKHMPIYHYVLSMDMHIGSICQFIIMSCQWTCTEKNVPDPIPDPFTWLSLKRIFMERAIGNNIKMQQRVSRLFPTGSLCEDKEGWFWRVFSQDSTGFDLTHNPILPTGVDRTLLMILAPPLHGGTALFTLLMSHPDVATLCRAGARECEGWD